ncbi:hypothetical protein [Streptomyces sp. NPDC059708]|uniref:hypothetical protein n=1 Tax=Streptomyces sp. NPDC059708 TaxID=3346916 RepID=UPI0036B2928B
MDTPEFFARMIAREEEAYRTEIQLAADLADRLAATPAAGHTTGDLTRLAQYTADALARAAKIETWHEALRLIEPEASATADEPT